VEADAQQHNAVWFVICAARLISASFYGRHCLFCCEEALEDVTPPQYATGFGPYAKLPSAENDSKIAVRTRCNTTTLMPTLRTTAHLGS
jgi:hypothetical protein